ncbi:LAETG motif-containing sortase-dependent surface protein [Streptomyces taklimakanensis]|uniref:LAETG motif-containing sortase-dependent surface protein n=1 Tax=Streptomyces taklimakanensis TaxID=2569853 RepID=UPI0030846207
MATAVVSAVVAPAALLVAPVAHATQGTPEPSVSTNVPAETPVETPDAEVVTETPAEGIEEGTEEPVEETGEPTEESAEDEGEQDGSTPSPMPSTPAASPSPSDEPSPGEGPVECSDEGEELLVDEDLRTSLSGLPSKVVAGSGFHTFKLNVANNSDTDYRRVDFGVFTAQIDEASWEVTTGHLTLQYRDPATGAWRNISLDENDEGAGYVGYSDVKAHTSYSVDLRLSVDASAPVGLGFAVSVGLYANDAGECVYAGDDSYYEFEVLKAGAEPGEVPGAKPQGGAKKPVPSVKPVGDTEIDLQGSLAETGSSSALPTIALIGGVTMAVGAGAIFLVRRRRTDGAQAAV